MRISDGSLSPCAWYLTDGISLIYFHSRAGYYPSALHRVTLPGGLGLADRKKNSTIPARYSIPYFVAPDAEGTVAPSPSLVKVGTKAAYEPITFKDYSDRKFAVISSA